MADNAARDANRTTTLLAESNLGTRAPVALWADPTTHALVTSASVSLSGSNIPIAGATTAVGVAIVDGSGNQITSFGGGTQYNTNAAYADGNTGTLALTIRDDALTTLTEADGDYSGLRVTSTGALWTTITGTVTVGSHAVTNAGTFAVQVDAAIPAGNNNIGDVDIASIAAGNNNIGDVDVASVVPGTGATNLGKAVDSAGGATDTGVAPLAIRDDALTTLTPVDGDYVNLRTGQYGDLWVSLATSLNSTDDSVGIGGAALTSLELIDDTVATLGTTTYTETTTKGLTIGVVRRDADTTLVGTTNEIGPLQMDARGFLKVEAFSGETLPVSFTGSTDVATQTTLASVLTSVQLIDDTVFTDDTSTHTPATTKVLGIGMVADDASTDSVNEGDIGMPRMTLDRKVITTVQPTTSNGLSVFNATSSDGSTALTNSAQAIKASAGQLYGWYIYNPNSIAAYVQLYNTAAASVTVGTTNPLFMLTIPAAAAANVEFTNGIEFTNAGFSAAATSTAGGNGAPTTALDAVFFYK